MAKNKSQLNKELAKYYSHLLINKTKRAGFSFIFIAVYVVMVMVIANHVMEQDKSWVYTAVPVVLLGIPLMLYPPVEQWVYKPWQAKAQKYERHYRD
ncbi:MAG: hypothetical protein HRU09_00260 [Oligoflexales bacterium]|nr:hypothetical protein [Oligoflexales bacterium]